MKKKPGLRLFLKTCDFLLILAFCMSHSCSDLSGEKKILLNGSWQFAVDRENKFSVETVDEGARWRDIKVPLSWQAQFEDLRDYLGIAWYSKTFTLPRIETHETVLLRFNAVDYLSRVYVNGHFVGEHEGGYTPFEFFILPFLHQGENEILVRVMDPESMEEGTEGISSWHIPHGKQNWYVQNSGIWQDVSISIRPKRHIRQIHIIPNNNGKFSIDAQLHATYEGASHETIKLRIFNPNGKKVFETTQSIVSTDTTLNVIGRVDNPILWHFSTPNLYMAELEIEGQHRLQTSFGFRSFEAKDGRLYLNNEPFYLIGALDQDFYPETIYSTPSESYLRAEMIKAKRIGLNMLRCHIKVPDPLYLKVADEVGMLVWYEVPNWDVFTRAAARRGEQTIDAMLERDWNHPSLVIVGLINESWGIDLQNGDQRNWLKEEFNRVKQKAEGRLVVDNSACQGNFHIKTDINDYHTYWAIPENRERFKKTIEDISWRPKWLFSAFGDSEERGDEPLILSEFGNWGLPRLPRELPWWFDRDFGGRTVTLPKGYLQRFQEFNYHSIFHSYDDLALASQNAQFMALKYEIEQIRSSPELQGYVITEFTDINWECNGLLDMWRNPKIYYKTLPDIQQQDVLIPRLKKINYWDDEEVEISMLVSRFSYRSYDGASLRWLTSQGERGEFSLASLPRGDVSEIGTIRFHLKKVNSPQPLNARFELLDANGQKLMQNESILYVYPRVRTHPDYKITIHDPMNALESFSDFVQDDPSGSKDSPIIITNVLDSWIYKQLEGGYTVLCLVDGHTELPEKFPFTIQSRESEWYDGNWASNFNWIRSDHPIFQEIAFQTYLGFEAVHVLPRYVMTGIPAYQFSDVIAGMFVGWIHLNSGYTVKMRVGNGRLLISTFNVSHDWKEDPYTVHLLHGFIHYAADADWTSQISWNF